MGSLTALVNWVSARFAQDNRLRIGGVPLAIICTAIFLSAVGVRFLHWQDKHVEIVAGKASLSGVFNRYQKEARRILDEGRILFPREQAAGDARLLAHPPGYSILLAAIYRFGGDQYTPVWLLQILCDAVAALLVFLIGLELLNWWVALAAGMLVALSPHLAYYSLILSPDSLSVPPILLSVYLLTKGLRRPRVTGVMLAGALVGLACWLNANAMLLVFFLAVVVVLLFERGRRVMLAAALVGSTIAIIAPLTIRNFVLFHRFIPLSIQAGLSLVEGIGDYDKEGRFGMPRSDREARQKDAEWSGRPEYAFSLWSPDGIDRDRIRFDRGVAVVRSNPGWFLSVAVRRAAFMLSYNDSRSREWPFSTASVAPISSEAGYGHAVTISDGEPASQSEHLQAHVLNGAIISGASAVTDGIPAKSIRPYELCADVAVSAQARVSLSGDGMAIEVAGDSSEYGDQFASASIEVKKSTDYVLALPVTLLQGDMALKVTSDDRRTALAIADITSALQEANGITADEAPTGRMTTIQMPFASGDRSGVRVVLSNNGTWPVPPAVLLGAPEIFETGPTPYVWTRYARIIVRTIQRRYTTGRMLALVAVGLVLLALARRGQALVMLLVAPLYYLTLQAPLHTEYRYTLAIHYFLFVLAGVTLGSFGAALAGASRWVMSRIWKHSPERETH